jgi:AMMECR1 domain-containing protein
MTHPLIDLAREAIRHYLATGEYLDVSDMPGDGPPCGLFVSLHDQPQPGEVEGDLRGCRGSIRPYGRTLYAEVVQEAVNSAVDDPRCPSIRPDEVDDIAITVYLLKPQEEVHSLASWTRPATASWWRERAAAARCSCPASPASRPPPSRST